MLSLKSLINFLNNYFRYETRTFQTTEGQPIPNLNQELGRLNLSSNNIISNQSTNGNSLNGTTKTLHSSTSTSSSHQKVMQKMEIKESRQVKSENRSYRLE